MDRQKIVLEGSRRRHVETNNGLKGFRRRWSRVLEAPGGVGSSKYCPGGLQKARVEKTSVLEVSRRRWIDKNSVLAAARRLSIWRQVRTRRTATGGGKRPKQLIFKDSQ